MWKAALAGALALAAVGVLPASAEDKNTGSIGQHAGSVVSESQIAQAKAALRLTPEQARHWPRVAAALRAAGRQSAQQGDDGGWTQRVRARTASISAQAAGARRVIAAAAPLIRTLNDEQKQAALSMVRAMGFGHLASSF